MPIEIREIVIKAQLESGSGEQTPPHELNPELVNAIRAICGEEIHVLREEVARGTLEGKFDR